MIRKNHWFCRKFPDSLQIFWMVRRFYTLSMFWVCLTFRPESFSPVKFAIRKVQTFWAFVENTCNTRPSKQCQLCIYLHDKSFNHSGLPDWFSWLGWLVGLTKTKPSQVMFMVKFCPTALNFGYDFVLLVHLFWDTLYIKIWNWAKWMSLISTH